MWEDLPNTVYFDLLHRFKDRVVIELAGHDHFASLRSHEATDGSFYHNIFVAPSITPWYSNNPGVSSFRIEKRDADGDWVPLGLRSTFLNLNATIGLEAPLPLDQLDFRELDFEKDFGLVDMSASSIATLAERLS